MTRRVLVVARYLIASAIASVVILSGLTVPAGAVMATPEDLVHSSSTSSTVTLKWSPVAQAPRYRIQLSTSPNMANATYHRFWGTTGKISKLKKATVYYAKVRVISKDGTTSLSNYSAEATVAPTSFSVPTGVRASGGPDGAGTVTWSEVPRAPRYRIQLSTSSKMKSPTYHRFWDAVGTFDDLKPRTKYYARVRVISADGINLSSYTSKPVTFTTGAMTPTPKPTTPAPTTPAPTTPAPTTPTPTPTTPDPETSMPVPAGLKATEVAGSMVSLDWDDVVGAEKYRIQYSTSSSMSNATYVRFTPSHGQIGGLTRGASYYVKVRVITPDGANLSPYSSAIKVTLPSSSEFSVTAPQQFAVSDVSESAASASWDAVPDATNYRIQLADEPSMSGATYIRSTSLSTALAGLKANTTYYAKVRVIDSSGNNVSAYSDAVQFKTSKKADVPLEIATWNIKCHSCLTPSGDRPKEEKSWYERRDTVAAEIVEAHPDVIGIQEAAQSWLKDSNGKSISLSQFEDLENRLKAGGVNYTLTNPHRNNCVKSTTPSSCKYKDQGASQGTKIYYDADRVTMKRQGSKVLPGCSGCNPRYIAWAELEQKTSGKRFFFSTVHLEPHGKNGSLRLSQARAALAEIDRQNPENLPKFVVGDFNQTMWTDKALNPNSWGTFVASGLVDPLGHQPSSSKIAAGALAETRVNANYNSFQDFNRKQTRYPANENGSNLDYVLLSPMRVLRWETVVEIDSKGDLSYPLIPSDHNMLRATVLLPSAN